MPKQLDVFFNPQEIIRHLELDALNVKKIDPRLKGTKVSPLIYIKSQLNQHIFGQSTVPSSDELNAFLKSDGMLAYPHLQDTLTAIYTLDPTDDVALKLALDHLKSMVPDWTADGSDAQFDAINTQLGYFDNIDDLAAFKQTFKQLSILCRTAMIVLEEEDAVMDSMVFESAYTLMALFINANQKEAPPIKDLINAANKLINQRDKITEKPFQDVFLSLKLPAATSMTDRAGWFDLIKKEGDRAFPFFSDAAKIESKTADKKAPKTIPGAKAAAALVKYSRGEEDPAFAALCYAYDTPSKIATDVDGGTVEQVFNHCLDYIATGWPKKTSDQLPDLSVKGEAYIQEGKDLAAGYYWVKLPPSDKRALILGKITDCCQSIGGNSEQCVKDAVSLPDNALYVLLKHKRGDSSGPKNPDGSINYTNFQIIGESYVWKSTLGDVCLDSIEFLSHSISNAVLRHVTTQFAQKILATDHSITRVQVGRGGHTPNDLFPETLDPLQMKQGQMYGDADQQYIIAQSPDLILEENPTLNAQWKAWQQEQATLGSVDHSSFETIRPSACPRDPAILLNELDNCTEIDRSGSSGQAAGRRELNSQQPLKPETNIFLTFLRTLSPSQLTEVLEAQDTINGRTLLHAAAGEIVPFTVNDILAL